jgi:hypothetical protein
MPVSEHSHITLVKDYLAAASARDFTKAPSFFADDLEYVVPGSNALSGVTRGPQAPLTYFANIMRLTDATYSIDEMTDWLVGDTRVALLAKESFTRNGKKFSWKRVIVFEIAGGRFKRVQLFDDDVAGLDLALGGA